jgi:hypothetical protein
MTDTKTDFAFETARLNEVLCESTNVVDATLVRKFRHLMGYPETVPDQAPVVPPSMGLTYGLQLGWDHAIFPPGAIRMGDEDVFGVPARVGDVLRTQLRIVNKFEKGTRRFMQYEMRTSNQLQEMVCTVSFTAIVP